MMVTIGIIDIAFFAVIGVFILAWISDRHHGMRCTNPIGHSFVKNNRYIKATRVCKSCGLIQKTSGFMDDSWTNQGYSEDKDLLIRCWKVEKQESENRSRQWKIDHKNDLKNKVIKLDPNCEKYRKVGSKEDDPQ